MYLWIQLVSSISAGRNILLSHPVFLPKPNSCFLSTVQNCWVESILSKLLLRWRLCKIVKSSETQWSCIFKRGTKLKAQLPAQLIFCINGAKSVLLLLLLLVMRFGLGKQKFLLMHLHWGDFCILFLHVSAQCEALAEMRNTSYLYTHTKLRGLWERALSYSKFIRTCTTITTTAALLKNKGILLTSISCLLDVNMGKDDCGTASPPCLLPFPELGDAFVSLNYSQNATDYI